MESKKENSGSKKGLVIALFIILGAVIGILLFMNMKKDDKIGEQAKILVEKDQELSKKIEEISGLKTELEDIKRQRDEIGLKSDSLKLKIENLNAMIKELKSKNAGNYQKRVDFEKQLTEIKKQRDNLIAEIAEFKAKNEQLNTEVQNLSSEKSQLGDSIANLKSTKTDLEAKVAIASILKAENLKLEIMDSKGKVREGDEFKSKRIDKLKITFALADNKVAKKDKKNIYLRLIEPSGAALFDMATGGGSFEVNDKTVSYTAKQTVDFTNSKQLVTFVYSKGSEYVKGTHKIEIYQDENQIGETSFTVR